MDIVKLEFQRYSSFALYWCTWAVNILRYGFKAEQMKENSHKGLPEETANHLKQQQLLNERASFQGHPTPLIADYLCTL